MNNSVYIRCAVLSDAKRIAEIQVTTWQASYRGIVDDAYLTSLSIVDRQEVWSEIISRNVDRSNILVATLADNEPIGFISAGVGRVESATGGEVYALYVLPQFQGNGTGRLLLYRSLACLQANGFNNAYVEVLEDCIAATFYQYFGGRVAGHKQTTIGGKQYETLIVEWIQLQNTLTLLNHNHRHGAIVNSDEVRSPDIAYYSPSEEVFTRGANFGRVFAFKRLGIHQELMEPGRRSSWPHAESTEDEFVYVISGSPTAWIDGEVYQLQPGDAVGFPAGTGIAHTFLNSTNKLVELLVVGDRNRGDNQVVYPLHPTRNDEMKEKGMFWESVPLRKLGSHRGTA